MYGKAFKQMYEGSMFGAGLNVFATWNYCLAYSDGSGCVEINPVMVSAQLGCSVDEVSDAIEYLMSPDPNSRTDMEDGRRLVREGQFLYHIVNHRKYQQIKNNEDKKARDREYKRRRRTTKDDRGRQKTTGGDKRRRRTTKDDIGRQKTTGGDKRRQSSKSSHIDIDVDIDVDVKPNIVAKATLVESASNANGYSDDFERFWGRYKKKVGKKEAYRIWPKAVKEGMPDIEIVLSVLDILNYSYDWRKENGKYIPNPATWLNRGGWDDQVTRIDNPVYEPQTAGERRELNNKLALQEAIRRHHENNDRGGGVSDGADFPLLPGSIDIDCAND